MTRRLRRITHGLVFGSSSFVFALFIGILGGTVNILVDFDHLPMVWGGEESRAFHTPLAIVAGVVVLYCFARLGGLLVGMVLRRKKEKRNGRNS